MNKPKDIIEFVNKSEVFFEEKNVPYEYYFATDEPEKVPIERPVLDKGLLVMDKDKSGRVSGPFDFIDESDIIRSLYNVKYSEFRTYCPEELVNELKETIIPV